MPDCWIFLLKRRRALSNVSFSPTRTSANPGFTSSGCRLACTHPARCPTAWMRFPDRAGGVSHRPLRGSNEGFALFRVVAGELAGPAAAEGIGVRREPIGDANLAA